MYVVLCLMDFTQSIMLVGNYLAKHGHLDSGTGVLLFFTMIKFPFYLITMYYCFLTYKELKALFMEIMVNDNQQVMQSFSRSWDEQEPRRPNPQPPQVFGGSGYRLG